MNFGRIVAAALVAWVVSIGVGYLAHDVLLADLYARHGEFLRPPGDIRRFPWAVGAMLLGFFVFAYAYAKGYEGGRGAQEGLRFGVIVGLLLLCLSVSRQSVLFPVSGRLVAAWAVDYIVEFALYGIIVGALYRPRASLRRPVSRATVRGD